VRIFYNTEFIERGHEVPIRLISIGMVREDGRELYLINGDLSPAQIYRVPFLYREVFPHLPMKVEGEGVLVWDQQHPDYEHVLPFQDIAAHVLDFCTEDGRMPELWADHAAYHHVCLAQMFGPMEDFPSSRLPMKTHDLQTLLLLLDDVAWMALPISGTPHHALSDAVALKAGHDKLSEVYKMPWSSITST
jgi:hypothetical protein